jgi:hypothetical protein
MTAVFLSEYAVQKLGVTFGTQNSVLSVLELSNFRDSFGNRC